MEAFVPRVSQLDAAELDHELHGLLKSQLQQTWRYLKVPGISRWEPELDSFLRFIIFKFSVLSRHATVGQELLNIKYVDKYSNSPPTSKRLWALCAFVVILHWAKARSIDISAQIRRWPHGQKMLFILFTLEIITKITSLFHLLLFLVKGEHLSILDRIFKLRPVPKIPQHIRQVGYEYISREVLWHGFAEFLVFMIPLVNTRQLMSLLRRWKKPPLSHQKTSQRTWNDMTKCGICSQWPTAMYEIGCQHVFCYHCIMVHSHGEKDIICPQCHYVSSGTDFIKPVEWINFR